MKNALFALALCLTSSAAYADSIYSTLVGHDLVLRNTVQIEKGYEGAPLFTATFRERTLGCDIYSKGTAYDAQTILAGSRLRVTDVYSLDLRAALGLASTTVIALDHPTLSRIQCGNSYYEIDSRWWSRLALNDSAESSSELQELKKVFEIR